MVTTPAIPFNMLVVLGFSASAAMLAACATSVEERESAVAEARQAVWGGHDDANTKEANVAVSIGGCSATLVAPRLVLTAAHCVSPDYPPDMYIGNQTTLFTGMNQFHGIKAAVHPGYNKDVPDADHPVSQDVALVWLDRPVLEETRIRRPTFVAPANSNIGTIGIAGWSSCGPKTDVYNPNFTTRQVVLWQDGVYQSSSGAVPLNLEQTVDQYGATWYRAGTDVGVCFGDSGGPLFIQHADNTREVMGVTSVLWYSGTDIVAGGWADITQSSVRSWIEQQALDSNMGGHQASWLTFHGKTAATFWYGEEDYTGTCDTARDPDCDHWYSEHDNDPATYNPQQLDASAPYAPCSQLCSNPTKITSASFGSGNLGSAASCYEAKATLSGMTCGNLISPRSIRVNGKLVDCLTAIALPAKRNGGYCFEVAAGKEDWAFFQTW